MTDDMFYPAWREFVRYGAPGPEPTLLRDEPELRVLIAGLEPGARIPPHPGPLGVYHVLEGCQRVEPATGEIALCIRPARSARSLPEVARRAGHRHGGHPWR